MASVNSRFDATPAAASLNAKDSPDGPWLSTYSRGLCSLYPKDEDSCWEALLSSEIPQDRTYSPFANSSSEPRIDHNSSRRPQLKSRRSFDGAASSPLLSTKESINAAAISSGATVYLKSDSDDQTAVSNMRGWSRNNYTNREPEQLSEAMTSPQGGRLSHAICGLGFDCIDFITATRTPEPSAASSSVSAVDSDRLAQTRSLTQRTSTKEVGDDQGYCALGQSIEAESRIPEDLYEVKGVADWAAAVCGKRTAALERKRVLSRTYSQESIEQTNRDPWFETLDRLSRWDEVAYR